MVGGSGRAQATPTVLKSAAKSKSLGIMTETWWRNAWL